MKKLIISVLVCVCVFSLSFSVCAQVISTKEPTAHDTVYVAGNPDLYPLEFYNDKTERYEGILPKLYEAISRQSGIDFSYVSADTESRQKELAENFQVDMVSAYNKGTVAVSHEIDLFTYESDGDKQTVCIGFTKITNTEVVTIVEEAIQNADNGVWMSAAMQLEKVTQSSSALIWLVCAAGVLLVTVILLVVFILRKRRLLNEQNKSKMIDPLTGIGNLNYFKDCYSHHLSDAMKPLYYTAYIAMDIERIETYFGSSEAEELQRFAANTITNSLQDNDFAARIDHGVFVCCFLCPDAQRAMKNATELLNDLNHYNESYVKNNGAMFRCGVFPLSKQNLPCETVIYNARQAYLYAVNEKQLATLCDHNVLNRVTMKSRLQRKISSALEREEFKIYLQFVYDAKRHVFCGAEVLSRWHSAEEGVLSPANYIEDMKLAGMIDQLDFYVLEKTCETLCGWKGSEFDHLRLSCNFTRTTLSSSTFAENFQEILSRHDFDRQNLVIELTEDSLVDDSATAYKNILAIKNLGCKIALDDLGSGYTSFSDLCDYPVDLIKIDRHIVTKASSSRGYAVLVGIVRMAHALGIQVLCEGVETENENTKVMDADCEYIQGFMYSRVLPLDNAMDFYRTYAK